MLFLVTVEMTIATTSLVTITDNIGGALQTASWVITGYELGYVGRLSLSHTKNDVTVIRGLRILMLTLW